MKRLSDRMSKQSSVGLRFFVVTILSLIAILLLSIFTELGTPFLIVAIFTLALAAFLTIRGNDELRKRDRKSHLLGEIIDWATDLARIGTEQGNIKILEGIIDDVAWPFISSQEERLETVFQLLRIRSVYIEKIAGGISLGLTEVVSALINDLKNQISTLLKYREIKEKMNTELVTNIAKNVANNNKQLYESALKVIGEATKTLVRDID